MNNGQQYNQPRTFRIPRWALAGSGLLLIVFGGILASEQGQAGDTTARPTATAPEYPGLKPAPTVMPGHVPALLLQGAGIISSQDIVTEQSVFTENGTVTCKVTGGTLTIQHGLREQINGVDVIGYVSGQAGDPKVAYLNMQHPEDGSLSSTVAEPACIVSNESSASDPLQQVLLLPPDVAGGHWHAQDAVSGQLLTDNNGQPLNFAEAQFQPDAK